MIWGRGGPARVPVTGAGARCPALSHVTIGAGDPGGGGGDHPGHGSDALRADRGPEEGCGDGSAGGYSPGV